MRWTKVDIQTATVLLGMLIGIAVVFVVCAGLGRVCA